MTQADVVILGAGAAGLMAAIEAGRRGRRVIVLDHARAPGEKIRISGGGRCNFTNLDMRAERFLSENPRFAMSALGRFTPWDFIARMAAAGLGWEEKAEGQLFCAGSARDLVAMLMTDLNAAGATLHLSTPIETVTHGPDGFRVTTPRGPFVAPRLVVATGGRSIPKMGATGLGYRIAQDFGLRVVDQRPGLVPLTLGGGLLSRAAALAGVSLQAEIATPHRRFRGGLLFTHRGLSGPAVLQASSYWHEGEAVTLDLAPGQRPAETLRARRAEHPRQMLSRALATDLPERLAADIVAAEGLEGRLGTVSNAALDRLDAALHRWSLVPQGTEGWRTAEVTLGGVATDALDGRTLAARKVPGLHFVGEVVDITGWLGGYNLQWAWSSGWAAGQAV